MTIKRHVCDIKRPSETRDSRGQVTGTDTTIAVDVPFSLKPLTGRERELARQEFADASSLVNIHLDPAWGVTPADYLVRRGGVLSGRSLAIKYIRDDETSGLNTEMLCGEGDL